MQSLILFSDGGSRGNPGLAAYGIVLYSSREKLEFLAKEPTKIYSRLEQLSQQNLYIGTKTNNEAEWQGLVAGLKLAISYSDVSSKLRVYLDSELVVKQLLGEYKVKKPELKIFYQEAKELCNNLLYVEFVHIRREFNKQADALVNEALDAVELQ